jgi:phosphopantetheine adenylyltransferase
MMNFKMNNPTAQLMGRYQPWHAGHRALFIKACDRVGQVVIMVRSQEKSRNNPYSYSEVVERIEKDLSENGYTLDHDFVIQQVPNITDITTGRDVGYTITSEKLPDSIEKISATEIRKNENNINNGTSR